MSIEFLTWSGGPNKSFIHVIKAWNILKRRTKSNFAILMKFGETQWLRSKIFAWSCDHVIRRMGMKKVQPPFRKKPTSTPGALFNWHLINNVRMFILISHLPFTNPDPNTPQPHSTKTKEEGKHKADDRRSLWENGADWKPSWGQGRW